MKSYVFTALIATVLNGVSQAAYSESIVGSNLIGSHFGIPGQNASYDYVVVGGGTAGLAVASRLAEDPRNTVAVIETGGWYEFNNGNRSQIPGDVGFYLGTNPAAKNPLIDWQQFTEPQPGLDGRVLFYIRGKTLGGSSARNFMAYQRGTKGSYQKWADEVGDESYTFENLLPHFERSATLQPPNDFLRPTNATPNYDASSFSVHGGPLKVSFPNHANAISSWFKLAMNELGLKEILGFTGGHLLGFQYLTLSIDRETQTRSSSEASYLRKALGLYDNLTVYTSALAKKIIFDGDKRATGVIVNSAGMNYTLTAKKEVILSAGAFRSPQLLMVSGVGPKETLAKFDIEVLADRPGIGQNMWDHLLYSVAHVVDVETHSQLGNPSFAAAQVEAYNTNRTGMLTNSGDDLLGWEKLPRSAREKLSRSAREGLDEFPSDWPEVEFLTDDELFTNVADPLSTPFDGKNYISLSVAVITPFSRGNVTINSVDTADNPTVSPNYLIDSRDEEVNIQAFKRARALMATKAMKPVLIGDEVQPGKNVSTDAEILDYIKKNSLEVYHASATCKMGKRSDSMAVVDSKANVIGVRGLKVVDASAFPFLPPGHPQATVYALAEKIAHEILRSSHHKSMLEDYGSQQVMGDFD